MKHGFPFSFLNKKNLNTSKYNIYQPLYCFKINKSF